MKDMKKIVEIVLQEITEWKMNLEMWEFLKAAIEQLNF